MNRQVKRPVSWLPIDSDWDATLGEIGTIAPATDSHQSSLACARDRALKLLTIAADGGEPGILVRSSLAAAMACAASCGVSLCTEEGRAAVAVALVAQCSPQTILGLKLGGSSPQPGKRCANTIGWAIIRNEKPVPGYNAIEVVLSE